MASPERWQTIESVVRHGGWLFFFLLLAPFLGPRDYGLFLLSFSGVKIVETLFATVAAQPLTQSRRLGDAHVATVFVTITATSGAVSLLLYVVTGGIAGISTMLLSGTCSSRSRYCRCSAG